MTVEEAKAIVLNKYPDAHTEYISVTDTYAIFKYDDGGLWDFHFSSTDKAWIDLAYAMFDEVD